MAPAPTSISMEVTTLQPTFPTDPVEIRRMEHATPGMWKHYYYRVLKLRCKSEIRKISIITTVQQNGRVLGVGSELVLLSFYFLLTISDSSGQ